jgi:hypothetical protein
VHSSSNASPKRRAFESAIPDFYLAHFDLTGKTGNITTAVGPSGLPILMDTFVRITKSPVVSIAKIRGCVRGGSSEFVLACDMRFAFAHAGRLRDMDRHAGHDARSVGRSTNGRRSRRQSHRTQPLDRRRIWTPARPGHGAAQSSAGQSEAHPNPFSGETVQFSGSMVACARNGSS